MESGSSNFAGGYMYPELMVIPMREELMRAGITEARTADEVDSALAQPGTTLLVVNSICGCAAGKMRPGVRLALTNSTNQPDHKITVFAGQDREATERARSYFEGNPPTSPAIAIIRDGKLVYLMQRFVIEQATAQQIAGELIRALIKECGAAGAVLQLQVVNTNPAQRLYERLGFIKTGQDQIYTQMELRPQATERT